MNQYKVIKSDGVVEYTAAAITATKTGRSYAVNTLINILQTQDNAPGVIWGKLENGNWVQLLWNNKTFCQFIRVITDPVDPPVPPDPVDPPVYPDFELTLSVKSSAPMKVEYEDENGNIQVLGEFPAGIVRVWSKNPTLQLV